MCYTTPGVRFFVASPKLSKEPEGQKSEQAGKTGLVEASLKPTGFFSHCRIAVPFGNCGRFVPLKSMSRQVRDKRYALPIPPLILGMWVKASHLPGLFSNNTIALAAIFQNTGHQQSEATLPPRQ